MAVKFFKTRQELHDWLLKYHDKKTELWVGYYKKNSSRASLTNAEVLDEMLCFGWIDGIRKSVDEESYCNRYTPRTARSKWSKINTEHIKRLIKSKRMMPSGLKAVEDAKADGCWAMAYESPKNAQIPEEFLKELKKNKKAAAFFKTLNKQNLYAITYRIQNTKKQETKDRWIKRIVEMLSNGEVFHV